MWKNRIVPLGFNISMKILKNIPEIREYLACCNYLIISG